MSVEGARPATTLPALETERSLSATDRRGPQSLGMLLYAESRRTGPSQAPLTAETGSGETGWRPEPESNRRARICSPLRNHSAIGPRRGFVRVGRWCQPRLRFFASGGHGAGLFRTCVGNLQRIGRFGGRPEPEGSDRACWFTGTNRRIPPPASFRTPEVRRWSARCGGARSLPAPGACRILHRPRFAAAGRGGSGARAARMTNAPCSRTGSCRRCASSRGLSIGPGARGPRTRLRSTGPRCSASTMCNCHSE